VLQVDPLACSEVVEAAFTVLRERLLADPADDAPARLAALNRAHHVLGDAGRRAEYDRARGGPDHL
jgi:hypothetical protein